MRRSVADLHMLVTDTLEGPYPYAGVPWFSTAFGRDGIITACNCCGSTRRSRGRAAVPGRDQAKEGPARADAEPGKILHETRQGEMARARRGSVRPLLRLGRRHAAVRHAGRDVLRAHRRLDTIRRLWPARAAALAWIDERATGPRRLRRVRAAQPSGPEQPGLEGLAGLGLPRRRHRCRARSRSARCRATCTRPSVAPALAARAGDAAAARCAPGGALRTASRSVLVRGSRDLRARARRRQAPCRVRTSNAGHCLNRHRGERAPRCRHSADDFFPAGASARSARRGALQSDVVPQRLDLAARQRCKT